MEKNSHHLSAEDIGINPPAESRFTTMFNNIGTGAMVGGAAPYLYKMVIERSFSAAAHVHGKAPMLFAVAGAAVGAVLGEIEGRRLQVYRHKVSDKIAEQENRIAQLEESKQVWGAREDKRENQGRTPEMAR